MIEQGVFDGVIIKAISGFFYVSANSHLYQCRARGILKKQKIIPLVGDVVQMKITHMDDKEGWIEKVYPRKSELRRPAVANVDQVIVVFALKYPDPHINLLDKLICAVENAGLNPIICLNKSDINDVAHIADKYKDIYESVGYRVILASSKSGEGVDELKATLKDKTSVFAGPSGVGKSSLLNSIHKGLYLKTGEVSKKIRRGKHTTRHTELFELEGGGFVLDTPGFTSMDLHGISEEYLASLFIEIPEYSCDCKFQNCVHLHEPSCAVKIAVQRGDIKESRYESYLYFLNELRENKL